MVATCRRLAVILFVTVGLRAVEPLPEPGTLDVVTTELAPAVLVRSSAERLVLFDNTGAAIGGPTRLAVPTVEGVRILRSGDGLAGAEQSEAWLLVWYAGSEGWSTWDVPVLVVLQHRAERLDLAADGLHLSFPNAAGDMVVMPLYGFQRLPQAGADFSAFPTPPPAHPAEWERGLPEAIQWRCQGLACIWRSFPLHAKEEFALDGDTLKVRTRVQFHRIEDDWQTQARLLAPLPPVLALAWQAKQAGDAAHAFPMQLSDLVLDPKVFTPYGPWVGIVGRESYTIELPLLPYVQTTIATRTPEPETDPVAQAALQRLRAVFGWKFRNGDWQTIWDHGGPNNFCWQAMGDRWYAKAIPFLPAEGQERARKGLHDYMNEFVLQPERFKPFREVLQLFGPGIGAWGGYDDAGKFSANLLELLWNYAYFTEDAETIRQHWELICKLFVTPYECDWKSFGRYSIAEMGDEAAPAIAMARLAHLVGDEKMADFASYIAVRELVHHYVKQVGIGYFRRHQPWHSMEPIPATAFPADLWGHIAGWQIDGPDYPAKTRERQYTNRWVRFGDPDVGRFYQDILADEVREELDDLTKRAEAEPKGRWQINRDAAHIMPSMVRLRRLVLNESPDQLAFYSSFLNWQESPTATRVIPARTTDYQPGLESLGGTHYAGLCLSVRTSKDAPIPLLTCEPVKGLAKVQGLQAPHLLQFGTVHPEGQALTESARESHGWNTTLIRCR
jgi:hypothetical protein